MKTDMPFSVETGVDAGDARQSPGPAPEHLVDERLLGHGQLEPAIFLRDAEPEQPEALGAGGSHHRHRLRNTGHVLLRRTYSVVLPNTISMIREWP